MADWKGNRGRRGRGKPAESPPARSEPSAAKKATPAAKGWRGKRTDASAPAEKSWTKRASSAPAFSLHRAKLFAVWGALIALLAAYVWWVFLQPKPTHLYLITTNTDASLSGSLSPLSYAAEDAARILAVGAENNDIVVEQVELESIAADAQQDAWIAGLEFAGPDNCAIFYFLGQGFVAPNGAPRIARSAPADLDQAKLQQNGSLERLLQKLQEQYPGKNKLILFDSARGAARWERGQLDEGFATAVQRVANEVKDPHRVVIVSQGNLRQEPNVPQLGGALFTRYLLAALRGAEVGTPGDDLTIAALSASLQDDFPHWCAKFGVPPQQPVILRDEDAVDFDVAYRPRPTASTSPAIGNDKLQDSIQNRFNRIDKLWELVEKLPAERCRAQQPLAWAQLEARLVALERLAVAGQAYRDSFTVEEGRAKEAIHHLEHPAEGLAPRPQSLAAWRAAATTIDSQPAWQPLAQAWEQLLQQDKLKQTDLNNALAASDGKRLPVEMQFVKLLKSQCDWQTDRGDQLARLTAQAVRCRDHSERLAAAISNDASAADVRLSFWIRSILNAKNAETRRRQAEDALIADDLDAAEKQYQALLAEAGPYAVAERVARQIGEAYQLSDKLLAEAPWLAEWSLRQPVAATNLAEPAISSVQLARQLRAFLDAKRTGDFQEVVKSTPALQDFENELKAKYDQLNKSFSAAHGALEKIVAMPTAAKDEDFVQKALQAVQCPLVSASQRQKLHARLTATLPKLQAHAFTRDDSPASVSGVAPAAAASDRLNRARQVLRMLYDEQSLPQPATAAAVVARLQSLQAQLAGDKPNAAGALDGRYRELSRQLSELRPAAWLLARATVQPETNSIAAQLQRIDQYEASSWLAERALDDFWGNCQPPGDAPNQSEFYFAQLADAYLNDAHAAWPDSPLDELREQLDSYKTSAKALIVIGELTPAPTSELTYQIKTSGTLPPGEAALCLVKKDSQGSTAQQRTAVSTADFSQSQPSAFSTAISSDAASPSTYQFQLRYRGHAVQSSRLKPVNRTPTTPLVFQYPQYRTPSVKVSGDERQVTNVMLILDCSKSMEGTISDPDGGKNSKMYFAKQRIRELLKQIKQKNLPVQVGLMAYGHRRRFRRDPVVVIDYKNVDDTQDPALLRAGLPKSPCSDVQVLVPVDFLDADQSRKIETYIGRKGDEGALRPWGETPLYFALSEAAKNLEKQWSGANNHLIALTDGENNQENCDPNQPYIVTYTEIMNRLAEEKYRRLRLQLIGFAVPNMVKKNLSMLPKANNKRPGEFVEPNNSTELERIFTAWLEENVKVPEFTVQKEGSNGSNTAANFVRFNETWSPPTDDWSPGNYDLLTRGLEHAPPVLPLKLDGWETLELKSPGSDDPLQFVKYDLSDQRAGNRDYTLQLFRQSQRKPGYLATALMPRQTQARDGWEFRVALQSTDRNQQTLAPEYLWAEVTPLGDEDAPLGRQPLYFCDVRCQSNRPVPILSWTVPHDLWPTQAAKARIRLWASWPGELNNPPIWIAAKDGDSHRVGDVQWTLRSEIIDRNSRKNVVSGRADGVGEVPATLVQVIWPKNAAKLRVEREYSAAPTHSFCYRGAKITPARVLLLDADKLKKQFWGPQDDDAMTFKMP